DSTYNLGIIAGSGLLPEVFISEIKNNNYTKNLNLYLAGFKYYTSKKLKYYVKQFCIFNSWSLTEIISFFKLNNVKSIVLLGYIPHKLLFNNNLSIDEKTKEFIIKLKSKTAMNFFHNLAEQFIKEGFIIEPLDKYIKSSFAEKGEINQLCLSEEEMENVKFGFNIAKRLSELDIGLTVVVKDKVVISVEAIEGTDNCILRAKKLAGKGCCVVKVARPHQDMRFDLPVVGPKTINVLRQAKATVLAIESGKTVILNKQDVIQKSKRFGIKLYGI
ncbi:MAG: UDP-2,3-diacylglucosamine diphosphatase LpxI, partial [Endomicrobia bacterium]|nr:UDP-2,3-diacylglucosamine diphosphatase LpxI [Endomicrobiia bacterium]